MAEGDSPLEITGLPQDTEYPEGTFEATRLENGRESERVDVPYFRTLYFADYEENDVELMLSVDGEETTGTYTILGMPQDKYVGGEHDENVVYAVQPDVAESGAVYFLGDQYVDRVVKDGEVIYGRNMIRKSDIFLELQDKDETFTSQKINLPFIPLKEILGKDITLSVYTKVENAIKRNFASLMRIGVEGKSLRQDNSTHLIGVWTSLSVGESIEERAVKTLKLDDIYSVDYIGSIMMSIETAGDYLYVGYPKYELGTTATPYTVAPEDLFPSAQTFPSFPEWPEEDTEERI